MKYLKKFNENFDITCQDCYCDPCECEGVNQQPAVKAELLKYWTEMFGDKLDKPEEVGEDNEDNEIDETDKMVFYSKMLEKGYDRSEIEDFITDVEDENIWEEEDDWDDDDDDDDDEDDEWDDEDEEDENYDDEDYDENNLENIEDIEDDEDEDFEDDINEEFEDDFEDDEDDFDDGDDWENEDDNDYNIEDWDEDERPRELPDDYHKIMDDRREEAFKRAEEEKREREANESKNWIKGAVKSPGALRAELRIKSGEKLTKTKINSELSKLKKKDKDKKKPGIQGLNKKDSKKLKRLNLAKTFSSFKKK